MRVKGSRSLLQFGAEALQTPTRSSRTQHRAFSQSCQRLRYGPVPKFTNLSSPDLEVLLTSVREKIIMPAHLTELQRNLIFLSRNKKELLIDPIKVTLSGEEFTLKPLNRVQDIPSASSSLYEAIRLMETKEDFENVPRLLEGLKNARAKLGPLFAEKVTKALGQKGQQGVILECARRGEKTGFDLRDDGLVKQILWFFHDKAVKAEFEAGEAAKALKWSEQLFELLELPDNKVSDKGTVVPKAQAVNVGVVLSLAAKNAKEGKDVDGKVEKYARQLLATNLDIAGPVTPKASSLWLGRTFPLVFGIRNAIEVLGSSSTTGQQLKSAGSQVQAKVDMYLQQYNEVHASEKGERTPSVLLYDRFFGSS